MKLRKTQRLLTPEEIRERNRQRNIERILNPPKPSLWERAALLSWAIEEFWCRHVTQRELYRLLDGLRMARRPHPVTDESIERIRAQILGRGGKAPEESFKARRCEAWINTPQSVLDLAEDIPGAKWMGLSRQARCALEEHGDETEHWACILNFSPPSTHAIWTHWVGGALPAEVAILEDCPAYSEEKDHGCIAFAEHPGHHGYDLYDAERLW